MYTVLYAYRKIVVCGVDSFIIVGELCVYNYTYIFATKTAVLQLSVSNNKLVRMFQVSKLQHLKGKFNRECTSQLINPPPPPPPSSQQTKKGTNKAI